MQNPAIPPITTPYVNASLYVGDLHPEVHEGMLLECFQPVGAIASVRVCRDSASRQSLGYGYVNYHSYADAERALVTLNYTKLKDRPIRIMWCQRDPTPRRNLQNNVFVKNLGSAITPRLLSDTFTKYGNVLSCKVPLDKKGEQKGYGFVHFEKDTAAAQALQEAKLNIQGTEIEVVPYVPREKRSVNVDTNFSNVYVKHFDISKTEEEIRKELEKYGEITSLVFPRKQDGTLRGYAFCNYAKPEQAKTAVEKASEEVKIGDKPLYVNRFQTRAERDRQVRQASALKPSTNVYIKNLDATIDDAALQQAFSPYGTITSAKVQRIKYPDQPELGPSRGFGFVNFTTPEEAQRAIAEMNGRFLNQKSLYVAPFQPRWIRQPQLNAQWAQRSQMHQHAQYPMYPPPAPMMYQGAPRMPFYGMVPARPQQWQRLPQMQPYMPQAQQFGIPQGQQPQQQPRRPFPPQSQQVPPNQQKRPNPQAGQQMKQPYPNQRPVKYATNVRNQQAPFSGLTATQLAAASPTEQKNMLGERLYALIFPSQGERAGKITGMLLEMDNSELLILLENPQDLAGKVQEAVAVLEAHTQMA